VEEVFDSFTLMALYELMRRRAIARMYGVVSSGKEARVYWAKSPGGEDLAVKIYLTATAEFKKGIRKYIEGDPRFEDLLFKDTRSLMTAWARKEYRNLVRLYKAGVRVPRPIAVHKTIVVMEFIGEDGVRAPLLKEAPPGRDEAGGILEEILEGVAKAYCDARLVHADLSEYNVMLWRGRPVLIDVSQAVDLSHPLAEEFLLRDLGNILRFFSREVGISVPSIDEAYRRVTSCREREG
jgi:RIO kinase 1